MAAAKRVDPLFGLYVRVMVAAGARRAEVCGLRWSDVEFDDDVLAVERSYTVLPGVRGDRPTKTRSARRVVLDPATLADLAEGWQRARKSAQMCGVAVDTRRAGTSSRRIRPGRRRGDQTPPTSCGRGHATTRTSAG